MVLGSPVQTRKLTETKETTILSAALYVILINET